jgi:glycerol-3-phosphate dehydrogenase
VSGDAGQRWSLAERDADLAAAARDGVDLLVVGGGITGAGVLRDASTRGMRALVVEREDFAAGTSSRSSKLIHGGLRYIGEGHWGTTREACRERDRLMRLDPHLVRPLRFLFPAYRGGKLPLWQVRAALWIYAALANFRPSTRFRMLSPAGVAQLSPDLRTDGLRGAGLYSDGQVDDARLVLETLKSARSLGCAAVNHAEVAEFLRGEGGRLCGARIRDALSQRTVEVRAGAIVNAAGPAVERVRGIDRPVTRPELRPAKGVHLVIPRDRVHLDAAVTFEASDGRHLFLIPWDDVALLGTTDAFSDEIDEPTVTIEEVHYLLDAANEAFPRACLTTNDLRSVFAGVRPLAADPDEDAPPSHVSREHRLYEDPSGLVTARCSGCPRRGGRRSDRAERRTCRCGPASSTWRPSKRSFAGASGSSRSRARTWRAATARGPSTCWKPRARKSAGPSAPRATPWRRSPGRSAASARRPSATCSNDALAWPSLPWVRACPSCR